MHRTDLILTWIPPSDARALLREWCWLVDPDALRPVMITAFGDWILEDKATGKVVFLDTALGKLRDLAPSRADMRLALKDPERRRFFLLAPIVKRLLDAGVRLERGQCYGWKVAPCVGGGVHPDNVQPLALDLHQRFQSRLTWRLRDHPAGTPVPPTVAEEVAALLDRDMTTDGPRPPLDRRAMALRGFAVALGVAIVALQVI